MTELKIYLFGRLQIQNGECVLEDFSGQKVQELFCYLLLNRRHVHTREKLADLLWGEYAAERAQKCLRQTLWEMLTHSSDILLVSNNVIGIHSQTRLWLDVEVFEAAYKQSESISGQCLNKHDADLLREIVEMYRGDLLEGMYQSWCLNERDRLQRIYFAALMKLMECCESNGQYTTGIAYGERILQIDPAHERTHQLLMLMHYLSGDRTTALRQYERCSTALQNDLGVKPAHVTINLRDKISADELLQIQPALTQDTQPEMVSVLSHLALLQSMLNNIKTQFEQMSQETVGK
jgi:DNA-binding SARP family transcriptional activator